MRIVHVLTRLLRAGSEENTIASCLAQQAAGHEVHLVHGRDFEPHYYVTLAHRLPLTKVYSLVHPLAPLDDVRAFNELRKLFIQLRPDIVHTHQSKAGIVGRLSARAARVPHIIHGVHIVPFVNVGRLHRIIYRTAERAVGMVTDAFIDVSKGTRTLCLENGIGSLENHYVIHSGFSLAQFHESRPPSDWRTILSLGSADPKPPVVVMLAAFEPRKRHVQFLEVFSRVIERVPDVQLIFAGDGPARGIVEAKIAALGIGASVRLVGYREDPEKLIALADICALTSTREGLPRVIMQYLASGKTCVVSNLAGLDEILVNGKNGVVTDADDLAAAADAIADLLLDRTELARLTEGAINTDLSSWDVNKMCLKIENVYKKLAAESASH